MTPDEILDQYFRGKLTKSEAADEFNKFAGNEQGAAWLQFRVQQRFPSIQNPPTTWTNIAEEEGKGRAATPPLATPRDLAREVAEEQAGGPVTGARGQRRTTPGSVPQAISDETVAELRRQIEAEERQDGPAQGFLLSLIHISEPTRPY